MRRTVEEMAAAHCSKAGTHNELELYLGVNLEETENIIGWWGVSIIFLLFNVVLIWCRITQHSTQFSHEWCRTTLPFKAQRCLQNVHS